MEGLLVEYMHCSRLISKDIFWVGANDRRLRLFENLFPLDLSYRASGVSYNSYLVVDTKTALLDTVDSAVSSQFLENVEHVLGQRSLDYLIINHLEPDHASCIKAVVERYPKVTLVGNAKTQQILSQFFSFAQPVSTLLVKEGQELELGTHCLSFIMAPMVHWPEVMVTYDKASATLFSADAFGTFGALSGHLFADEYDIQADWLNEYRRYYANIVGKYGIPVQTLLKKAANLKINTICPLHGPIWRKDLGFLLDLYGKWSSYTPETKGVLVAYSSIYGHTANAAEILTAQLVDLKVPELAVYDTSSTDVSVLVAEAFRLSHFAFLAPTYNAGLFPAMEQLLNHLQGHHWQNRTGIIVQNGSWAPAANAAMEQLLGKMKNLNILGKASILSAPNPQSALDFGNLAQRLAESLSQ